MADSYLGVRLDILRRSQNPDGGWSFYQGKQSWLEPTFYGGFGAPWRSGGGPGLGAAQILAGEDGSWPPTGGCGHIRLGHGAVRDAGQIRGELGEHYEKGVAYLLKIAGTESELWRRALAAPADLLRSGPQSEPERLALEGRHFVLGGADRARAGRAEESFGCICRMRTLRERIRSGEALLLDVRCSDGGWNYGSPWTLGEDQRSYPETTALALLGLQGRAEAGKLGGSGAALA